MLSIQLNVYMQAAINDRYDTTAMLYNAPHDEVYELHDDLVEHVEEVFHDARLFAHLTDDHAERDAEAEDACQQQRTRPITHAAHNAHGS